MDLQPTQSAASQIAFVFNNVGHYEQLLAAFRPDVEVHVLDAGQDGLAQIAAVLAGRSGIDAVHVIGHGAPGSLDLGALTLNSGNIGAYAGMLGRIGSALAPGGDILLYGCDVGAGAFGARFVGQVAQATGADVAASTDPTGGEQRGGDWTLEYRTGSVTADGAFDAAAVRSLDMLLTPSVKDVTDSMATGAFVPGFTLTATSNTFAPDPDAAISGIYVNSGARSATYTISADGTSVGSFDLTGMTFVKFVDATFGHYVITVTGYKAGGGTATAKIDFATNTATPTVPDDFSDMTGLASFDVTVEYVSPEAGGGAWDITLDAFSVDNVAAPPPGTPDLTAGTDAGTSNTDNITNANTVAFTGTGADGASVTAFIDKNNNGVYDAGTDIAGTATVAAGSWTVSGLSTAGLADGTYKVYARQTISGATSGLSSALNITVDRTAPALAITSSKAALKVGETATITFTFSEDPGSSFDASDIAVSGGTLSGLTTTGAVRTATFTPTANTNATTASITVASGSYTDAAGNNGGAGATPSLTFDTKAPTLTVTSDKTVLKAGETATITFTFSEDPGASFVAGDVGVTGGTLSGLTTTGAVRTATFTPTPNTNAGTASISVAANAYTDGAGNNGGGGTAPGMTFDTLAPTVTISSSKSALKVGETATITFTFSEDPGASFAWDGTTGDVAVTGGTLGAISGSGTTRSATFTPDANTNAGTASITIASGTYADTAGNAGGAGSTPSVSFDTKAPTVTISSDKAALGTGETATITFTFSEDPGASFSWDGTSGDVAVSGGTLGAITGSGTTRTAVFTAGTGSSASISVTAASYSDAAGNTGAASSAFSITLDSTPPDAPSTPVLAAGSDTGSSTTDNLTKLATPTVKGTAEAGSTVKLYDGATEIGSGTADGAGNWSIMTSTLAGGAHAITAKATDAAGNTGPASGALAITVDAT
ncbi:MAG TPA: Ig-like domain-containing protein, partial [Telluria sp.]|nr:Ig-like domain-containing protein [Telluria sp.]